MQEFQLTLTVNYYQIRLWLSVRKLIGIVLDMQKDFAGWHIQKLAINNTDRVQYFREREIWWTAIGHNVGTEEDGKGSKFARPVLVVRKYNARHFYGLPLSTTKSVGPYYFPINSLGVDNKVLLTHMRAFDALRLINKAGVVDRTTYDSVIGALMDVIAMSGDKSKPPQ